MIKITTISVLFLLLSFESIGGAYDVQWKKATNCYLKKQYDSAVIYFEKIAKNNPKNAEVYYNLGNSYYRLNKIAPAVLNYERALHINPSYQDAKDNLSITQARISHSIQSSDAIFFIKWWRSITSPSNASLWAILAAIAYILSLATIWIRRYHKRISLPFQLPGILIFICVCSMLFAFKSAALYMTPDKAVVFENDAPLMNRELKGKPLSLLPEGTTVIINAENDLWAEVTLPDGRSGWVMLEQIKKL